MLDLSRFLVILSLENRKYFSTIKRYRYILLNLIDY